MIESGLKDDDGLKDDNIFTSRSVSHDSEDS